MSTVIDALQQGKTICANTSVKLPIEGEATIYGFVPYHHDFENCFGYDEIITCPPIGVANIIGDRVIFRLDGRFFRAPIFDSVSKVQEKYPVFLLYIPRFFNLSNKSKISAYKKAFANQPPRLVGYEKYPENIRTIDGIPFYFPTNIEFIFGSSSKLSGIGNAFVVLTRRIASESGMVFYEVYNPKEVEIIDL